MAKRQPADTALSEPIYQMLQTRCGIEGIGLPEFIARAIEHELRSEPVTPLPKSEKLVGYPLMMGPSLHKRLKKAAYERNTSMAVLIRSAVERELNMETHNG